MMTSAQAALGTFLILLSLWFGFSVDAFCQWRRAWVRARAYWLHRRPTNGAGLRLAALRKMDAWWQLVEASAMLGVGALGLWNTPEVVEQTAAYSPVDWASTALLVLLPISLALRGRARNEHDRNLFKSPPEV